jgi:hypothetical protein
MSFTLELNAGAIVAMYSQQTPLPFPKPFLQILRLQPIEAFKAKLNTERYKLLLSDGLHYMQALLSPKFNNLVYQKHIGNTSIIKLTEFDVHLIKGKKLLVVVNFEEIISSVPSILGSPTSVEIALDFQPLNLVSVEKNLKQVNSLGGDFLHLLNNPELSDVTFILGDRKCFAHKNILVSRSPYFHSLLLNGMRESYQTEIIVSEWESDIFMAVLRFIYSDQVIFNATTPTEFIWSLFMAARYYGLDRLAVLCEQFMISARISLDTVCLLWNTASEVDNKSVAFACIQFIEQNFEQLVKTDHYFILSKELFLRILLSENITVSSQDVLVEAIMKWTKAQIPLDVNGMENSDLYQLLAHLRQRKRISNHNVADVKNAVLDVLRSAGVVGLRFSRIMAKLQCSCSVDDLRKCVQILQAEGQIQTRDGEHFISCTCTDKNQGLVEVVHSTKRRRLSS